MSFLSENIGKLGGLFVLGGVLDVFFSLDELNVLGSVLDGLFIRE